MRVLSIVVCGLEQLVSMGRGECLKNLGGPSQVGGFEGGAPHISQVGQSPQAADERGDAHRSAALKAAVGRDAGCRG